MTKKYIPDLHVETSSTQSNFFYLSVLQYRKENHLVIIDNISGDLVTAYVIDRATQEGLDVKELLSIITRWYYESSTKYPISIEFSKLGISGKTNKILKNFDLDHVARMVGQDFRYDFTTPPKVRRRRVQQLPVMSTDISARTSVSAY